MFIMTLGGFGAIWEEIHETEYIIIGEAYFSFLKVFLPPEVLLTEQCPNVLVNQQIRLY